MAHPYNHEHSSAIFSVDRLYRYELWRRWKTSDRYCLFIGLNPSTADAVKDDPTIRRCVAFAKRWGYDALCMVNLFALRATNPEHMLAHFAPIGPENDAHIELCAKDAGIVIAGWGANGNHLGRAAYVNARLRKMNVTLHALKFTNDGQPRHPLYLRGDLQPIQWS